MIRVKEKQKKTTKFIRRAEQSRFTKLENKLGEGRVKRSVLRTCNLGTRKEHS